MSFGGFSSARRVSGSMRADRPFPMRMIAPWPGCRPGARYEAGRPTDDPLQLGRRGFSADAGVHPLRSGVGLGRWWVGPPQGGEDQAGFDEVEAVEEGQDLWVGAGDEGCGDPQAGELVCDLGG